MTSNVIPITAATMQKAAARRRARIEAARRLLAWREAAGWSQERAAHELGAPVRTYRSWETAAAKLPGEVLVLTERAGRKAA